MSLSPALPTPPYVPLYSHAAPALSTVVTRWRAAALEAIAQRAYGAHVQALVRPLRGSPLAVAPPPWDRVEDATKAEYRANVLRWLAGEGDGDPDVAVPRNAALSLAEPFLAAGLVLLPEDR